MKVAKEQIPHRESSIPLLIDDKNCPEKNIELEQLKSILTESLNYLSDKEKEILFLSFGMGDKNVASINKICRKFTLNRIEYDQILNTALQTLKENFHSKVKI
jgi:DNA-directed RNA polymerase sigma subunit (sigma70/sigma32)